VSPPLLSCQASQTSLTSQSHLRRPPSLSAPLPGSVRVSALCVSRRHKSLLRVCL
jgi:hypothetical protein